MLDDFDPRWGDDPRDVHDVDAREAVNNTGGSTPARLRLEVL